jgi:hypothetical protein
MGWPLTVMLINPAGLEGSVPVPFVALVAEEKLSKFNKNCCHALVGLLVVGSKNSDWGYGLFWVFVQIPFAI